MLVFGRVDETALVWLIAFWDRCTMWGSGEKPGQAHRDSRAQAKARTT